MIAELKPETLLEKLSNACSDHGVRGESLLADFATIGIAQDVIDACMTALELLGLDRPWRAYPMVRIAFEATQRLLVLATSSSYIEVGTRAWLYYRKKDANLATSPKPVVGVVEEQLIELWATHHPSAREIVNKELAALEHISKPDNFLGRNMAEAVNQAYAILSAEIGSLVPNNAAEVNRAFYASLSRESHAAIRLEPKELHIDSDGFVNIVERPRTRKDVEPVVRNAMQITLAEALSALRYRIEQRRLDHAAKLGVILRSEPAQVPPGYIRDIGSTLVEKGLGHTKNVFPGVPIQLVNELPDGTLSVSVKSTFFDEEQLATFDFKGKPRQQLLSTIKKKFPDALPPSVAGPLRIKLPEPIFVTIEASLGNRQRNAKETFIPLIVTAFKIDTVN